MTSSTIPTGVESAELISRDKNAPFPIELGRFRLIQAILHDQTDVRAELLQEREWLLHTNEGELRLQGNAFALENVLDGSGTVFLKLAPLPHARPRKSEWDLRVQNGALELFEGDGYEWRIRNYQGGKWGRIAATHAISREIRPYNPAQDGLFLTNTWGDRNKDGRISAPFIEAEIEAAARLGADVFQIDDGWQKGTTANSVNAGGTWGHYYAQDADFWAVNLSRLPDGLEKLFAHARESGLRLGLWFSPDSSDEGALWERDVETLLRLHRELGVTFFKVDGLKIQSEQSEKRLESLFQTVLKATDGAVCFDFDITAEERFGYFALIETGPLFVENRYTDWHRYWPHHTLRVAWQLAHWVDPVRLRLEWLNNARNDDKYPDDPLAPSKYRPDVLFATTMFCAPLGWFEAQNLPASYTDQAAPLIEKWKEHRESIHGGTILPIGEAPDGAAWTGFVSLAPDGTSGHVLVFRELSAQSEWQFRAPFFDQTNAELEILGGQGSARLENGTLMVQIPAQLQFVWARFGRR